ncbi:MAG TPA: aminoglycoside phosphotransferase family protein [Pseudonocardiaceae bacterium]|nr:aminoglycoside phosphotransferase family protein [Pseudonocardiaceae bacterium]
MPTATSLRNRSEVRAACAVAAEFGLGQVKPVLLRDRANLLVHLSPAPVVVRVATVTASVRPGVSANLARDVALATFLAESGAPAVPPSDLLPPGPHERDGHTMTFWRYLEHEPDHQFAPAEFAALLADLHPVLARYPGELPSAPPIEPPLLAAVPATPERRAELVAEVGEVLAALRTGELPVQPLHGDAHPGNVLWTRDGPVWNDFEDAWCGPVAWDLACMLGSGRLDGRAALAAYPGAPSESDLGVPLRARQLQAELWTLLMAERFPAA